MEQLTLAMNKDNFVECRAEAMSKSHPDYGKPQAGTRTAARGQKARTHVHKEILELCEVIYMNGFEVNDDDDEDDEVNSVIFFGDLFRMYTRISDKVVGILLRAKKYGLVFFEPEMLFQGLHDETPVFLTLPMTQIYKAYNDNDQSFVLPANAPKGRG